MVITMCKRTSLVGNDNVIHALQVGQAQSGRKIMETEMQGAKETFLEENRRRHQAEMRLMSAQESLQDANIRCAPVHTFSMCTLSVCRPYRKKKEHLVSCNS